MADKLVRAQVRIPRVNGAPEDDITNTWYFDGDDGNADASYHSAVMTMLQDFYHAIDGVILSTMLETTAHVTLWDMRDAEPRLPEFEDDITLTLNTGVNLPCEDSICLSFAAADVSGVNPQRRRGRVYLGPITYDALQQGDADVFVPAGVRSDITTAAAALMAGEVLATTGTMKWAVYSPTTDLTSSIDDAFNDVVRGWVDSAVDIQRRRGQRAAARTTF